MARSRRAVQEQETNTNTSSTTTKERTIMADALSLDVINELLAGARVKGAGDDVLESFLNSDEAGIEVDLTSGPFAGKTAAQASTSLNNAKKRMKKNDAGEMVPAFPAASQVQVIKRKIGEDERVFLIDKAKVGV